MDKEKHKIGLAHGLKKRNMNKYRNIEQTF